MERKSLVLIISAHPRAEIMRTYPEPYTLRIIHTLFCTCREYQQRKLMPPARNG